MKRPSSNERGYLLVFFAITVGLLLSFSALVIDGGQSYIWKMRVDKAAKAAALAGLGYRGFLGWEDSRGAKNADLISETQQVALDNLKAYGELSSNPVITATYDSSADTMKVDITLQRPSFFAGRFSGLLGFSMSAGGPITGSSTAQLNPAYIALLLDVSGSMLCGADTLDGCACRLTGTCNGERLTKLIEGVDIFRKHFNPNRDYIGVIAFNLAANVIFPIAPTPNSPTTFGTPRTNGPLQTVLSRAFLEPFVRSNTNICDSLIEAIGQFQSALPAGRDGRTLSPSVVLFSDGAPNAFRGIFLNPSPSGTLPANVDAYQYALEWYDDPLTYRGPGPIVRRRLNGSVPTVFNHTISAGSVAPAGTDTWGGITSDPRYFQSVLDASQTPPTGQPRGPLTNLNFSLPYTNGAVQITGVPFSDADSNYIDPNWQYVSPAVTAPVKYQNYDQLPYYCSIAAADYLRMQFAASLYVIGLGPPQPQCGDPMQDADDHLGRKDSFLARLANAPNARSGSTWLASHNFGGARTAVDINPGGLCTDPDGAGSRRAHRFADNSAPPVYVGYQSNVANAPSNLNPTHPELAEKTLDTTGEYFPARNANELNALFGTIAKQILLRLVGTAS